MNTNQNKLTKPFVFAKKQYSKNRKFFNNIALFLGFVIIAISGQLFAELTFSYILNMSNFDSIHNILYLSSLGSFLFFIYFIFMINIVRRYKIKEHRNKIMFFNGCFSLCFSLTFFVMLIVSSIMTRNTIVIGGLTATYPLFIVLGLYLIIVVSIGMIIYCCKNNFLVVMKTKTPFKKDPGLIRSLWDIPLAILILMGGYFFGNFLFNLSCVVWENLGLTFCAYLFLIIPAITLGLYYFWYKHLDDKKAKTKQILIISIIVGSLAIISSIWFIISKTIYPPFISDNMHSIFAYDFSATKKITLLVMIIFSEGCLVWWWIFFAIHQFKKEKQIGKK